MNNLTTRVIFSNDKNQILILKDRDSNYWGLPGGGVEPLESPLAGLAREIKEEISITLDPSFNFELVGVEYRRDKRSAEVIFIFYGGVLTREDIIKIKPANEIGEAKFMDISSACKFLTPNMAKRLALIFSKDNKGAVYLEK